MWLKKDVSAVQIRGEHNVSNSAAEYLMFADKVIDLRASLSVF